MHIIDEADVILDTYRCKRCHKAAHQCTIFYTSIYMCDTCYVEFKNKKNKRYRRFTILDKIIRDKELLNG